MKKKGKLVIGTTMILLFAAGFAVLRNDHFVQEETQESTAQTESDAQAEEVAQTASMVQIYVDPSEYDQRLKVRTIMYRSIRQQVKRPSSGRSTVEVGQPYLVKQKRWLKSKQTME